MTTSLIDGLNSLATPDLTAQLATSLNEPAHGVAGSLTGGMASMLMGVLGKSGDPAALQSIFNTVTSSVNDGHVLDDPASRVGSGEITPMTSLGDEFLSNVFGNRADAVTEAISQAGGLHTSSVTSLLKFAAPLVLGFLGKRVRDGGLNLSSFVELVDREQDSIRRVAPRGVATAFGMKEYAIATPEHEIAREISPAADALPRARRAEPEKGRNWFLPAMATLALLALFWGVKSSHRAAVHVEPMTSISGGEVAMPAVGTIKLRNGTVLFVAPSGSEGRLAAFLADSMSDVKGSTWVVLDHMQFENNSSILTASSEAQIANLAKVLQAYPTARIRIGGFTDNVGSAQENMRLSRDRAESAREAIVQHGVDPSRVGAVGFGEAHPLASNATEEGRATNRRISLLVLQK